MRCPSCELLVINGVICHEHGCQDRRLNLMREVYTHDCHECGCEVESNSRTTYTCDCVCDDVFGRRVHLNKRRTKHDSTNV